MDRQRDLFAEGKRYSPTEESNCRRERERERTKGEVDIPFKERRKKEEQRLHREMRKAGERKQSRPVSVAPWLFGGRKQKRKRYDANTLSPYSSSCLAGTADTFLLKWKTRSLARRLFFHISLVIIDTAPCHCRPDMHLADFNREQIEFVYRAKFVPSCYIFHVSFSWASTVVSTDI